jgi:hypothetical protein
MEINSGQRYRVPPDFCRKASKRDNMNLKKMTPAEKTIGVFFNVKYHRKIISMVAQRNTTPENQFISIVS